MEVKKIDIQDIVIYLVEGKSPLYTLELSKKFDFQPSPTKPNNRVHQTIETE